jgi:hypothetical protein
MIFCSTQPFSDLIDFSVEILDISITEFSDTSKAATTLISVAA